MVVIRLFKGRCVIGCFGLPLHSALTSIYIHRRQLGHSWTQNQCQHQLLIHSLDIRQVWGCVQVTGEGETGREQESARTGELSETASASLPLWNNAASPLSSRSRISPSLPNLSPSLPHLPCPSPNLVVSQGPSLTGPDLCSIHRLAIRTVRSMPRQMHSSIPRCPAWLIPPTPRCHPLLQHSSV